MNSPSGLVGRGLLQSQEDWNVRNRVLAENMCRLAEQYLPGSKDRGLDVGCQAGDLTDYLNMHTAMAWDGIDPVLQGLQNLRKVLRCTPPPPTAFRIRTVISIAFS